MGKLTADQIKEYFDIHLPYRTGIMLAHYKMTHSGTTAGHAWLNPCFEASVITGRMYLNILGVFKRAAKDELYFKQGKQFRGDDVSAEDLGGRLIDKMPVLDEELFVRFMKMADKACAHFTMPDKHAWEETHEAIRRICFYFKIHLYDEAKRPCPEIDEFLGGAASIETLVNAYSTHVSQVLTVNISSHP